ncbi:MAG: cupredoxin domain-containing protein [bacterium]|nr:cupredoxin domain-containing protein [bacterium]
MKQTIIATIIAVALIGGTLFLTNRNSPNGGPAPAGGNVTVVDGRQVITIDAKGGYAPRETVAQAGLPTTLLMKTRGTFDCSSALVIPSLGYRSNLPPSGEAVIEVPPQAAGTTLEGLCAMGMYNFSIRFE